MIGPLLGAVQFLTVIPVRRATPPIGRCALFFPLVGAWLGIMGATLLDISSLLLPGDLPALVVLAFWAVLTGALADAFRSGRAPDKILAILKDSRIGAHGALALLFGSLVRWQALAAIAADPVPALAASLGLARGGAVALAWTARPAGSGLGLEFSRTLTTPVAVAVLLQSVALSLWCGMRTGITLVATAVLIVTAARAYFHRRIGGFTGDCLGATAYTIETVALVLLTCRSCIS
jgi:adenosylcobinamide-GDP ribazoletransferase